MAPTFDRDALISHLAAQAESIKERLALLTSRLAQYDAISILALAKARHLLIDPNTYAEPLHDGFASHVEYIAALLLRSPLNLDGPQIDEEGWEAIESLVHEAFSVAMFGPTLASLDGKDPLDTVRFSVASNELLVRNAAYREHLEPSLRDLFGPFDADLLRIAGFTVEDAIAVADAVVAAEQRALDTMQTRIRELSTALEQATRKYKRTGSWVFHSPAPDSYLEYIDTCSTRKELREAARSACLQAGVRFFEDAQVHGVNDLAAVSGVERPRVQAFFELTSLRPGDVPVDYLIPSGVHPLRTRPYVRLPGDNIIAAVPGGVVSELLRILEGTLKPHTKTWNRYQKHRHDWTLDKGLGLLKRLMPDALVERELSYEFNDGEKIIAGELDGLVSYDTALMLVEAKGHTLDDAARRGAPKRLRKRLKEIVTKAHEQALRARRHLHRSAPARFEREKGSPFDINYDGRRVFMIALTLEPMGHIAGHTSADEHGGLLNDDAVAQGDLPWIVCVFDLMVMADLLDLPPAFPHYIERRLRAARQSVTVASDELDFFGLYLHNGLYFDESDLVRNDERVDFVAVGSFTVPMDAYYHHRAGIRTHRTRKPALKIAPKIRRLVERIDASGYRGRLDLALAILDGDDESRRGLMKNLERSLKRSRRKGKPIRFVLTQTDDSGYRVLFGFVVGSPSGETFREERIDALLEDTLWQHNADAGVLAVLEARTGSVLYIARKKAPRRRS